MSYLKWNDSYQELLDCWVLNVTTKLVSEKKYNDIVVLMSCLHNFELLGHMAIECTEQNIDSRDWLARRISELASYLSDIDCNCDALNQSIYDVLQDFSEYMLINKLDEQSVVSIDTNPRLNIPEIKAPGIIFNK